MRTSHKTRLCPKARSGDRMVVMALALAPAIGLGITRFTHALRLPDMRASLGWSHADVGWMTASNALGFLLGALVASRAIVRIGAFPVMAAGTLACVAALGLGAGFGDFPWLCAARFVAGLGGSVSFIAGGVLTARVASRHEARGAFLLALFYAGPGLGIVLSGTAVPLLLAWKGPHSWQEAWGVLAMLSLGLSLGLLLAREAPVRNEGEGRQMSPIVRLAPLLAGCFAFGVGSAAYMTFMIAWIQTGGHGAFFQAGFWSLFGIAAMASLWLWSGVLATEGDGYAFGLLTYVTALGSVLPLASARTPVLLVSAAVFGSAFLAVVAATTEFVRRNLPRASWASSISALTVAFGLGQSIGPGAIGALTDATGKPADGLTASAILLLLSAGIGAIQRDLA